MAQVVKMLLQCRPRAEIVPYITAEWGVTERTARLYVALARKDVQKEFHRREQISLTWHLKARQNLVNQAIESGDHRAALAAMQDVAKLQGLYVEKHEVTGKDGAPIEYIKLPETAKE